MNIKTNCPTCGGELAESELQELCPRCLFQAATSSMRRDMPASGESEAPDCAEEPTVVTELTDRSPGEPAEDTANPVLPTHPSVLNSSAPQKSVQAKLPEFPGYELLEELARGGMGVVYRAKQLNLDRIVAVKMMLSGKFSSQVENDRFDVEAQAAAQLDHANIVPIFEVGEHDGHKYFSMAYVDGTSLDRRLAQGPLPTRTAATMLCDLAKAVAYAHERGVVHRDLKPGNIMLDKGEFPRITDFGLAKRLDEGSQLTATGQALGTPSYMAPEQAAGRPDHVGPPADVYALGAILYSMLAGKPPFVSDSPVTTMMMVIDQEPVPPKTLNADIPADLETICLKCLEKKPEQRYASASALAEDLRRYLNDEPIEAATVSGLRLLRKWRETVRRNKNVRIRSRRSFMSWPLVDIAFGRDLQQTEETGHAKGIFAFGNRATGLFAYGGVATGFIAIGGTARGFFALGSKAIGVVAWGAFSFGLVSLGAISVGAVSAGGLAVGFASMGFIATGYYTVGFISIGVESFGGIRNR